MQLKFENALGLELIRFAPRYECLGEGLSERGEIKGNSQSFYMSNWVNEGSSTERGKTRGRVVLSDSKGIAHQKFCFGCCQV